MPNYHETLDFQAYISNFHPEIKRKPRLPGFCSITTFPGIPQYLYPPSLPFLFPIARDGIYTPPPLGLRINQANRAIPAFAPAWTKPSWQMAGSNTTKLSLETKPRVNGTPPPSKAPTKVRGRNAAWRGEEGTTNTNASPQEVSPARSNATPMRRTHPLPETQPLVRTGHNPGLKRDSSLNKGQAIQSTEFMLDTIPRHLIDDTIRKLEQKKAGLEFEEGCERGGRRQKMPRKSILPSEKLSGVFEAPIPKEVRVGKGSRKPVASLFEAPDTVTTFWNALPDTPNEKAPLSEYDNARLFQKTFSVPEQKCGLKKVLEPSLSPTTVSVAASIPDYDDDSDDSLVVHLDLKSLQKYNSTLKSKTRIAKDLRNVLHDSLAKRDQICHSHPSKPTIVSDCMKSIIDMEKKDRLKLKALLEVLKDDDSSENTPVKNALTPSSKAPLANALGEEASPKFATHHNPRTGKSLNPLATNFRSMKVLNSPFKPRSQHDRTRSRDNYPPPVYPRPPLAPHQGDPVWVKMSEPVQQPAIDPVAFNNSNMISQFDPATAWYLNGPPLEIPFGIDFRPTRPAKIGGDIHDENEFGREAKTMAPALAKFTVEAFKSKYPNTGVRIKRPPPPSARKRRAAAIQLELEQAILHKKEKEALEKLIADSEAKINRKIRGKTASDALGELIDFSDAEVECKTQEKAASEGWGKA